MQPMRTTPLHIPLGERTIKQGRLPEQAPSAPLSSGHPITVCAGAPTTMIMWQGSKINFDITHSLCDGPYSILLR
eukprot:CCRYP_014709-RA/>CCRYP_014709-RA protein AED:0.47 eAED:1.00 QI:0/-1/0/1/-1/0/1/0/74